MQEAVLKCCLPKSGTHKERYERMNKVTYGDVLSHYLKRIYIGLIKIELVNRIDSDQFLNSFCKLANEAEY